MREIKFRAWDETTKYMVSDIQIQTLEFGGGGRLHYTSEEAYTVFTDKYVLLQFIGLKDKNGKEIYEGDIIKLRASGIGKIVWHRAGLYWKCKPYKEGEFMSGPQETSEDILNNGEVIGNIYENSELLKGDKH